MTRENARIAEALEAIARTIQNTPTQVIGTKVTAVGGPGGGSVTGLRVTVTADGTSSGKIIGYQSIARVGERDPADVALIKELFDAAAQAREGNAPKGWLEGLLARVESLKIPALVSLMATLTKLIAAS